MKTKFLSAVCAAALAAGGVGALPVYAEDSAVYVDQSFTNGKADFFTTQTTNNLETFSHDAEAVWNYALRPDGALRIRNTYINPTAPNNTNSYGQIKFDTPWTGSEDILIEFKFRHVTMWNTVFEFRPFVDDKITFANQMFIVSNQKVGTTTTGGVVTLNGVKTDKVITDGGVWHRAVLKTNVEAGTYSAYVDGEYVGESSLPTTTIYGFRFGYGTYPVDNAKELSNFSVWIDDFKVQKSAATYLESSSEQTVNHRAALNFNNDIDENHLGAITIADSDCNTLAADKYKVSLDYADKSVVMIDFDSSVSGRYTVDYSGIAQDCTFGNVQITVDSDAIIERYAYLDFADGDDSLEFATVSAAANYASGETRTTLITAAPDEVWSEYNANGSLLSRINAATEAKAPINNLFFVSPRTWYSGTRAAFELKFKPDSEDKNLLRIQPFQLTNSDGSNGRVSKSLYEIAEEEFKFQQSDGYNTVRSVDDIINTDAWNMARVEIYEDRTTKLFINGQFIADGTVPDALSRISGFAVTTSKRKTSTGTERENYIDDLKFYTVSDKMLLEGSNLDNTDKVSKKIYLDFETVPTGESLSAINVKKDGGIVDGAVASVVKNSIDDTLVEVTLADTLSGSYELDYTGVANEEGSAAAGTLSFVTFGEASEKVYYNETWANGISSAKTQLNPGSAYTADEVYTYDTTSAPASFYNDGMLKINNKATSASGSEAYFTVNFDEAWQVDDGDMQVEFKVKQDTLLNRNMAIQPIIDGKISGMILFDQRNLKLSDGTAITKTYPIDVYADKWMNVVIKTDNEKFTVWINNEKIGDGIIPNYSSGSSVSGIRFLDKIWSTDTDRYSYWDEFKAQKLTSMYLENMEENSNQDKDSYILDFNNALNPYSVKKVSVTCKGEALPADLYTVAADSVDRTRLKVTLSAYAPAGEYVIDCSEIADNENGQAAEKIMFTRVRDDYCSDIRLTDNMDGTATAAVDTIIYNDTASYLLILAVYDEDEFTGERTLVNVVVSEAKNYSGQKNLTCTVNAAENQVVQACLWSGFDTMKPKAMKWKTM